MTIRTVALLGANSQIGKDYIENLLIKSDRDLYLFSRQPALLSSQIPIEYEGRVQSLGYEDFGIHQYDLIVNFVGASNPNQISSMGDEIFKITNYYDDLVIEYLKKFTDVFYIFISSGAAYGDVFSYGPAEELTESVFNFNSLQASEYYGASKYFSEKRHRELVDLKILDLRVFSYFSKSQDLESSLLVSDVIRSIKAGDYLKTNGEDIYRDYIGAVDFYNLMECLVLTGGVNASVDAFSLEPVNKIEMLNNLHAKFGLNFFLEKTNLNFLPSKKYYYSEKRCLLDSLGFVPKFSSLELILQTSREILTI